MLRRILLFIFFQVAWTLECVPKYQFMDRYNKVFPQSTWMSLFDHEIGEGSFGVAYKIPFGKERFAVLKRIPNDKLSLGEVRAEAEMQKRMNDIAPRSTPKMYHCIQGDTSNYIVMEFVPYALERPDKEGQDDEANSGLRLADFRSFNPFIRLIYYKLLIEGLADIHDAGYVHNDIKRENIMFGTLSEPYIRYIDFGFVCGFHDDPQGGTPAYMDSEFLYNFQQSKHSKNPELVKRMITAYKKRNDNYMTDIFALALTIYRIESASVFDSKAKKLVEKDEIIKERDIWANKMANLEWAINRKINFCSIPDGENIDKVCFHDIIKRMTNHQRISVNSKVNFLAKLNPSEPTSGARQSTIENAHNPTLTRQLAKDITRIINSNWKDMQEVYDLFIEAERLRALFSQPSKTSKARILI